MSIPLRTPHEIESIARAGRVVWDTLDALLDSCVPGATTRQLDTMAAALLRERRARPLTLGLAGEAGEAFPGVCCVSVNDIVAHEPPSDRALAPGDVVSVDLSASLDGWCADACRSVIVVGGDPDGERLRAGARACLEAALRACRPGAMWSQVAAAVLEEAGAREIRVVPGLGGHGIGRALHEAPLAWLDPPGADFLLHPGLVLTLEPAVTSGSGRTRTLGDGWSVATLDAARAACEERTVAITPEGPRVLTGPAGGGERKRENS